MGQYCVGRVASRLSPAANGISLGTGISISIRISISISPAISLIRRGLFEANELPWQLGRGADVSLFHLRSSALQFSIYILFAKIVSCQKKCSPSHHNMNKSTFGLHGIRFPKGVWEFCRERNGGPFDLYRGFRRLDRNYILVGLYFLESIHLKKNWIAIL